MVWSLKNQNGNTTFSETNTWNATDPTINFYNRYLELEVGNYWLEVELIENGKISDRKNKTVTVVDTQAKLGWMGVRQYYSSFNHYAWVYFGGADKGSTYDVVWSLTDEHGNTTFNLTHTWNATSPTKGFAKYHLDLQPGDYTLSAELIEDGISVHYKNVSVNIKDRPVKISTLRVQKQSNTFNHQALVSISSANSGSTYDMTWSLKDEQGNIVFNQTKTWNNVTISRFGLWHSGLNLQPGQYVLEAELIEDGSLAASKSVIVNIVDVNASLGNMNVRKQSNTFYHQAYVYLYNANNGSTYDIIWSLRDEQGNIVFNQIKTWNATTPSTSAWEHMLDLQPGKYVLMAELIEDGVSIDNNTKNVIVIGCNQVSNTVSPSLESVSQSESNSANSQINSLSGLVGAIVALSMLGSALYVTRAIKD